MRPTNHVFINCPFDEEYRPLFDAAVFAVYDAGFVPRCALESIGTGETRLSKIMSIVGECHYGLHDLSRTELNRHGLPRFNMPFELGLFLGCRRYGGKAHHDKQCLVMDTQPYRYQQFLSDIAGQDISDHGGSPQRVVAVVRDWLRVSSASDAMPGAAAMGKRFELCQQDLPLIYRELRIEPEEVTFADYTRVIVQWLRENPL